MLKDLEQWGLDKNNIYVYSPYKYTDIPTDVTYMVSFIFITEQCLDCYV